MFRVISFLPNNVVAQPVVNGNYQNGFATLDAAKKAMESTIHMNKTAYQNGYTIYVVDTESNTIVSTATVPTPSLEWKDTK